MHDFTPLSSLAGGALIGLAASLLLVASGRIAGISGIVSGLLLGKRGDRGWRMAFLAGLLLAGVAFAIAAPNAVGASPRSLATLIAAGVLVGVGTRLGNGCTSGHGVCGISRLSVRSLTATATFVGAGMFTATLGRWLGGGS
jgi:uncharacterized membrane protein YedE/YeeE